MAELAPRLNEAGTIGLMAQGHKVGQVGAMAPKPRDAFKYRLAVLRPILFQANDLQRLE